jgi:hypothetical protein
VPVRRVIVHSFDSRAEVRPPKLGSDLILIFPRFDLLPSLVAAKAIPRYSDTAIMGP